MLTLQSPSAGKHACRSSGKPGGGRNASLKARTGQDGHAGGLEPAIQALIVDSCSHGAGGESKPAADTEEDVSICARVPVMPPVPSSVGAAKGRETFCHVPGARNSPPVALTPHTPSLLLSRNQDQVLLEASPPPGHTKLLDFCWLFGVPCVLV